MGRGFAPDDVEWIVENYSTLGPTRIAEKYGKHPETVKSFAKMMKDRMRAGGDPRWKKLDASGVVRRKAKARMIEINPNERIVYYGPKELPKPIEGKYGICPPWLVVTFPAYQKCLIDLRSGGTPGHGGGWQSEKQCSGRDIGAVHQVSMVEMVGHRVGD